MLQPHTMSVKVTDFGLAKQKGCRAEASAMHSAVGTILYSCPEIVQQMPYTHKADVWSLGCLVYKMATLRDPFRGCNPLSVARRIVECDYERLEAPQHSAPLVEVCEHCLRVRPAERPDIVQVCLMIEPEVAGRLP